MKLSWAFPFVLLSALVIPALAADSVPTFTMLSRSSTKIDGFAALEASDVLASFRQYASGVQADVGLAAGCDRLEVREFRVTSTTSGISGVRNESITVLPPAEEVHRTNFGRSDFRITALPGPSAFVLYAAKGQITPGERTVVVTGVRDHIRIRGPSAEHGGVQSFVAGETGSAYVEGLKVGIRTDIVSAESEGRTLVYFLGGEATIQSAEGETHLVSAAPSSQREAPIGIEQNTRSFFEMEGACQVSSLFVPNPTSRLDVFAASTSAIDASSFAADSADSVDGPLPEGVSADGPSLWMRGRFDVTMAPKVGGAEAEEEPRVVVRLSGSFAEVSRAGGVPTTFASVAVQVPLMVALIALGLYFKAMVVELASRLAIPLYSKLRKEKLLNVQARDRIYRAIKDHPGINFLALHSSLRAAPENARVAFGALAYHLSQMERFELIVSKREGRYRRYYDVGAKFGADAARIALLQTQPIPVLARHILATPGIRQTQLLRLVEAELNVTRQALAYHLRRLEAKELVVRELEGRFRKYVPTERLAKLAAFIGGPATPAPVAAAAALPASA